MRRRAGGGNPGGQALDNPEDEEGGSCDPTLTLCDNSADSERGNRGIGLFSLGTAESALLLTGVGLCLCAACLIALFLVLRKKGGAQVDPGSPCSRYEVTGVDIKAVARIQGALKGRANRAKFKAALQEQQCEEDAAVKIQSVHRGKMARAMAGEKAAEKTEEQAAVKIQSMQRGKMARARTGADKAAKARKDAKQSQKDQAELVKKDAQKDARVLKRTRKASAHAN